MGLMAGGGCAFAGADDDAVGMMPTHRDGHAANLAGECAASQQSGAVQGFDACPLTYAEFPQTLPFRR